MLRITLFLVAAAALAGCATTRQERVAAVQAGSAKPTYPAGAPNNGRLQRNADAMPTAFPQPTYNPADNAAAASIARQ
jgi:hypothetical protein